MSDLISRQAAIVALDNRMSSCDNVDMQIAMGFAKGIINDLSSVSAENVGTDHWEKLLDELYDWLNDTRLNIAPDETVKDDIERHERLAQADMLDEVVEYMLDLETRRED